MIIKITPHPDQIRYYAELGLGAFETLDHASAVREAQHSLRSIIRYLNAIENLAATVSGVDAIEQGGPLKIQESKITATDLDAPIH